MDGDSNGMRSCGAGDGMRVRVGRWNGIENGDEDENVKGNGD